MAINPTVQDPMYFPLVGVIQHDRWWWVYGSVGNFTRASGLQQRHMEHKDECTTELGTDQVGMHVTTPSPRLERVPGSDGRASSRGEWF